MNRFDMSLRDTEQMVHRTGVSLGMHEGVTNHQLAVLPTEVSYKSGDGWLASE